MVGHLGVVRQCMAHGTQLETLSLSYGLTAACVQEANILCIPGRQASGGRGSRRVVKEGDEAMQAA